MSVTPINHAATATSRLTGLYQDKAKWKALLELVASAFDDFEPVLLVLGQLDDVDARAGQAYLNGGIVLDLLGDRVGQRRRISDSIPVLLFGWDEDNDALPWGEDDDELSGGAWFEDGQATASDAVMDDPTYRVAIRMRRDRLASKTVSFETIIHALLYVFPDAPSIGEHALILGEVTGTVLFGLGRKPTSLELALFRYSGAFPKPAGVEISGYWWTYGQPVFAFDDDLDPQATGWYEEDDTSSGGTFAEEF